MAANGEYAPDKTNCDWVEIYNATDGPLALEGLYLARGADSLREWAFPAGAALGAHGRAARCTCAAGDGADRGEDVYINDAFKIDKSGGALILSDGRQIIDAVSLGEQFGNVAYGRPEGQGAFRYLNTTTFLGKTLQRAAMKGLVMECFTPRRRLCG